MAPRVWFITGASSGFGLHMARKALSSGEKVVATLRKPEVLADLAAQYTKEQLLVIKLDVTKLDDIAAGFEAAKKAFGRIDVVYNNAGFGIIHEVETANEENARQMFETNFWGEIHVMQSAVTVFRDFNKPCGGLLLNMNSMLGILAYPGIGFYCATKFAVEAMTDALVGELDPAWNIKVCTLCPGWFKTNMTTVNAIVEEPHPSYAANENLGSMQTRKAFVPLARGDSPLLKDAAKLVEKIWQLSESETLPRRVAFGDDAKAAFEASWTSHKKDLEISEEWSKDLEIN